MKVFIICLVLVFAAALAAAAPRRWTPMTKPRGSSAPKFPLYTGTPGPRIPGGGELQNEKTAVDQVFPPAALAPMLAPAALSLTPTLGNPLLTLGELGASLGVEAVKHVVCASTLQLQEYAGNEKRDAKIMALIKVMSDMLAAQEMLSKAKKLNMEENLVAKAELFGTIGNALDDALDVVGDTAKKVLCSE